ncbi:retrovirus-related Pol polyprotein from transposon TNT 1-94 [Trichonephila clavipes]|nr:retrovirus-related Pol polyprotein from transposon TNT 1-94 [Trichonephila clavipes]
MQVLLMHYGCWKFIVQTKPEQPDEKATYKEKLDLQLHGKKEDFRVVKIEAELILEANRLQLMKQDLEKAENAYLSSFTSKKSKTLPGATAAAHGDPNGKNDYQKKSGRKPSVLHLKPFGCLAYAGVPKQIRKKFDMRAKMGIMMGYAQRTKGYRIWLIDENKLVETINGFSDLSEQQEALMVEVTIPNCYKQAIRSRDASKWRDAMDKEINVMMERKVWDLVDHPDNIKILENRWVYTIKYDEK